MGVTIHFAGQLGRNHKLSEFLDEAEKLAGVFGWTFQTIEGSEGRNPEGFVVYPHPDCEPLRVELGPRFIFRDWVKTQFAGPSVHIRVVEFLRELKSYIGRLGVSDEGEYWETGSEDRLREHIDTINRVIQEMRNEKPTIRINVHEPDGRIVDVIG